MKMADLISRAAAIEALSTPCDKRYRHGVWETCLDNIETAIRNIPTVETAPVVHARWINYPECLGYDGAYTDEHIVCSACHSVWNIIDNETDGFNHCPACGAKMDGERRDEDA